MAQLSRPYQIGLAGIVLLAAVWLVLIQGRSPSPASTASVAPVTSTAPQGAASSKHAGHGTSLPSAPGVPGLTRAIDKARGAVSTSQKAGQQLEEKSAQASSATTSAPPATNVAPAKAVTPATSTSAATAAPKAPSAPTAATHVNSPSGERAVEAQLAQGKVVLILFWNPKGADDMAIHNAIGQLHSKPGMSLAVNQAPASAIASFGTITRGIQVYGTPTLLIINRKGQTITLTGPQDSFAITQAIQEARHS